MRVVSIFSSNPQQESKQVYSSTCQTIPLGEIKYFSAAQVNVHKLTKNKTSMYLVDFFLACQFFVFFITISPSSFVFCGSASLELATAAGN